MTLKDDKLAKEAKSIYVGVSACLMGREVRYNGGHSRSKLCIDTLSKTFTFKTFCPEMAAGFGVPRPTMRLVGDPQNPTLTFSDNIGERLNEQLINGFTRQLDLCTDLDGYILMKKSPSCGMERIKVYQESGYPHETKTRGLFADALIKRYPQLPVEEDGRLNDAPLRENFIMRVFAHHHFRHEVLENPCYHKLLQYHSRYKYLLMAHSQQAYREIGRFLAKSANDPLVETMTEYLSMFMSAVSKPAKRSSHCNALQHILGYLKRQVPGRARQDILTVIEQYRREEVNLITPITLLTHYVQQLGNDYIRSQRYLTPYPTSLGLRNRV